ncbi:hypothetical protein M408DRAFT_182939 [Serendipita vermifera MAFF 305830]|uniref:F-box domain-containing protein n=1 Tax=Serendipita vermifera MAFF 305830 TaxID=933852 RepID=A0A0C3BM73_SERVB|nr:hypothetical protein M408DRAFT_182939 [Serendipita vermifera MAFF 305830]
MATHSTPADPPEICRKLEALQHQYKITEDLCSRIKDAQLECARLETEISEYRASVAPIRRFPQELLLMFFEYYICENPRIIRHLLPVCKQWYELAIPFSRLYGMTSQSDWKLIGMSNPLANLFRNAWINAYISVEPHHWSSIWTLVNQSRHKI